MKRLILRFTLLAMVVGLGTVVVYEVQRRLHPPETPPGELASAEYSPELQPIPLSGDDPARGPTALVTQASPDGEMILAGSQEPPGGAPPDGGLPAGPPAEFQPGALVGQPYAQPDQFAAEPAETLTPPGTLPEGNESERMISQPAEEMPSTPPTAFAGAPSVPPASIDTGAGDGWQDNFSPPSAAARGSYRPNAAPPDRMPATAPDAAAPDAAGRGAGRPGERQLEGAQAPSLTIEKRAPKEIQVGKAATFVTVVRNHGQVTAEGVEVRDMVPQGTELVGTTPPAQQGAQGELTWQLGTLKPGAETSVQMQLMPLTEGEVGSVATLHFQAGASVRSVVTRPQVAIEVSVPPKVMVGTDVMLKIKISNPGTGAATGVVLTETVPPGLAHPDGGELELEIGTLRPGESRTLDLALKAVRPGPIDNVLTARAEANVRAEGHAQFEVIAPDLKVAVTGPKKRFLERQAVYTIAISNPGTAPANDIELAVSLPKGMKFVEANNAGQYDKASGNVFWSLEELPPGETGVVTLAALPIEAGEHHLQVNAKAKGNLSANLDEPVYVEGIATVLFELVDVNDPVEVGGETTYEIRVVNQGSKAASNVRVVALLPAEMQATAADGPTAHAIDGQRVLFEPIVQLAPKADTTFTVKAKALAAGDVHLRVQLMTDEMRSPVTKEESTHVYADE